MSKRGTSMLGSLVITVLFLKKSVKQAVQRNRQPGASVLSAFQ
jgi:hypothetical protein